MNSCLLHPLPITIPLRQFRFSAKEYKFNSLKLRSTNLIHKKLKVSSTGLLEHKPTDLHVIGFPFADTSNYESKYTLQAKKIINKIDGSVDSKRIDDYKVDEDSEPLSDMLREETKPRLVMIQCDPMHYIHSLRQLVLQNMPYLNEYQRIDREGLFSNEDLEESMIKFTSKVEEMLGDEQSNKEDKKEGGKSED
jgi:hypothetical protein